MDLYKNLILLRKLPLTIESTYAYDDYLLIGTKEGHLLMYKIDLKLQNATEYEFKLHLLRSAKQFSRKPIIQMEAILEYRVLVSLSDQMISVHNLDKISFPFLFSLNKSKGATYFSLEISKQQTLSGQIQSTVRLCVAVKNNLLFFYWKNNEFFELRPAIKLPDVARVIVWINNRLFVGLRNQYIQVDIDKGSVTKMFPVTSEPLIVPLLTERNLAFCREDKTFIFDYEARPLLDYPITWTDQPLSITDDLLFLIAVQANSNVEILCNTLRDVIKEPLLQKTDLSTQLTRPLKAIAKWCNRPGQLVLHSDNDIVLMKIVPNEQQIRTLQNARQFELAIKLIEFYNMSPQNDNDVEIATEEYDQFKLKIRKLHAIDLFSRFKFNEAISLFQSLKTDPSFVIALYPGILPDRYRSQLLANEPNVQPPPLEGAMLERGLLTLIEYLVEIRQRTQKQISQLQEHRHQTQSNTDLRKLYELLSIIDTSLLKCYLQTNESLVASLLRIENHCHLEESEMALKRRNKIDELIILYKTKGLHKNALNILQQQARDAPVKNAAQARQQLIQYLQELGSDHLDLIFEYSEWILRQFPEEGMRIFIDVYVDSQSAAWLKDGIVQYLEQINPDLALAYLDHYIENLKWSETSTKMIDTLINKYRDSIRPLIAKYRAELIQKRDDRAMEILNTEDQQDQSIEYHYLRPEPAGQEPGKLGQLRRKLMHVLEICDYYTMETLSAYLLHDGLFEERAIVLGKMGNHREAVMIYVHILNDLEMAEQYCWKQFKRSANCKGANPHVFDHLFEQCLRKPLRTELTKYLADNAAICTFSMPLLLPNSIHAYLNQPANRNILANLDLNVRIAIAILAQHSTRINLIEAIELLDDKLPLQALYLILPSAVHHLASNHNHTRMLRRLLISQRLKVHRRRIQVEQAGRVIITGTEICQACMKRIGKSVFVRYSNNQLVHLGCRDGYELLMTRRSSNV